MDLLWGIGVAAATGTALFVGGPAALAVAGFSGSGIVAGETISEKLRCQIN